MRQEEMFFFLFVIFMNSLFIWDFFGFAVELLWL